MATRPDARDVKALHDRQANAVGLFPEGEAVTAAGVSPSPADSAPGLCATGNPCLVAGTPVATPFGPRPIEATAARGDPVATPDGPRAVVWAGSVGPDPEAQAARQALRPTRIARGNDTGIVPSPRHGALPGTGPACPGAAAAGRCTAGRSARRPPFKVAKAGRLGFIRLQ